MSILGEIATAKAAAACKTIMVCLYLKILENILGAFTEADLNIDQCLQFALILGSVLQFYVILGRGCFLL